MRRAWDDGTRAILFEPHELIEKLAALVPRPRINLLLYHGVFGPSARLRSRAVAAAWSLCASEARDGSPAARNAASTRIEVPTSGLGSMLPGHTIGRPPLLGSGPAGAHDPLNRPSDLARSRALTLHGPSYCGARSRSTFSLAPIVAGGSDSSRRSRTPRWHEGFSPTLAFRRNVPSPCPPDLRPTSRACSIRSSIESQTALGQCGGRAVAPGRDAPCRSATRGDEEEIRLLPIGAGSGRVDLHRRVPLPAGRSRLPPCAPRRIGR